MNDQIAELGERFPAPAERDLPPGRHAMHRERLMSQITAGPPVGRPANHRPARRRPAPGRVAALTAAAAVAAAGTFAAVRTDGAGSAAPAARPGPAQFVAVQPGDTAAAPVYLDRIAKAAAGGPATAVGPGQWFYTREESEFAGATSQDGTVTSPWTMYPMTVRETWLGQRPSQESLYRQNGQVVPIGWPSYASTGILAPSYAWAQSLPADPARLLTLVYAELQGSGYIEKAGKDGAEFRAIGGLLSEAVLPPAVQAAFYRAAALIPGVSFIASSTDAAGRAGIGIALTDNTGERYEWIFSKATYEYLGERDYQARTTVNAKAGTLIGLSAILARGVADSAGGAPRLIP